MIHFIWLGTRELRYPDFLAVATARAVYPKDDILLWIDHTVPMSSEREMIRSLCTECKIPIAWRQFADKATRWAEKSDYLRCEIVYKYGGIYIDLDTLCLKSLYILPLRGTAVGREGETDDTLNNCIMFAEKRHEPVVKEFLDRCKYKLNHKEKFEWKSGLTLGPHLVSEIIKKTRKKHTVIPKPILFKYDYRDWQEWFKPNPIPDSMFMIHWFNTYASDYVFDHVDPDYIKTSDSLYATAARKTLGV